MSERTINVCFNDTRICGVGRGRARLRLMNLAMEPVERFKEA